MHKRLTKQEKEELIEKYKKNPCLKTLSIDYAIGIKSIRKFLQRRNILPVKKINKYTYNENYFDKIETEHKAYWLGFLYADGCNSEDRNTIRFQLQEKDIEILEKFNKDIESNRPLTFIEHKTKHPTWQNQYTATICSKHMSQQLSALGCHQAKSLSLLFPANNQVPEPYIKHFLRGLWDGDGSISIYNVIRNKKLKPRLCGCLVSTLDICSKISTILKTTIGVNSHICAVNNRQTTTRRLKISGTQQNFKVMSWLYENSSIYLERKYKKFESCKQKMIENGTIFHS